jgi:hypothetical protein
MGESGATPQPKEVDDLIDWKEQIKRLWIRVFLAVNKAAALGVALLIHKGLDWAARWFLPEGWEHALTLSQGVFFVIFSVIYLHFLWEMLATFVPAVRQRTVKKHGASNDEPEDRQQNLF